MLNLDGVGKLLVLLGVVLIAIGGALLLFKQIPFLGKLPGDIVISRKNFTLYIPLTTSIILSILLSLVLYLFSRK